MLDFSKETDTERLACVETDLARLQDTSAKLDPHALSTMADYILWGKSTVPSSCTAPQLQTAWAENDVGKVLSLSDENLTEASFRPISSPSDRTICRKQKFDRSKALRLNPTLFANLFREIDRLDLAINFWEVNHGRRKTPPRESLLEKFTDEEQRRIFDEAATWTQQQWLRQRHQLIEKRREQFYLFYAHAHSEIAPHGPLIQPFDDVSITLGTEIPVYPLGLKEDSPFIFSVFEGVSFSRLRPIRDQVSNFYWAQKAAQETQNPDSPHFDFTNPAHLAKLVNCYSDIRDNWDPDNIFDRTPALADTFDFYFDHTQMPETQRNVVLGKIAHKPNAQIRDEINSAFNTTYHENYISTLFNKRALPKIAETAKLHQNVIGELFFPENFKPCTTCGRWLPRTTDFFYKRVRTSDGFGTQCKACTNRPKEKKRK